MPILKFSSAITCQLLKFTSGPSLSFCTFVEPTRKHYSELNESDLRHFRSLLGDENVKTVELDEYNVDFMRWFKGRSQCVLLPHNVEHVSSVLKHCYARRLAVVPQAGNTGLVGGSVPVHDEIILSTKRLANKFHFDVNSSILDCDAGFVLEEADNLLAKEGYMVPVDLGSKGSCLIGGIVATNAGGIRLIRYGSLHAHVTGLEVVLPDAEGTILKLGSKMRKDNTELHLHKLFIGSEGQLGIITKVQMQVVPRPISVQSAFVGVSTFSNCLSILRAAKQHLNEILSSFELIDGGAMQMVKDNAGLTSPFDNNSVFPFHLLIETSGSNSEQDLNKMERFLAHCFEEDLAVDGVLAKSAAEAQNLWKFRENCSLGLRHEGYVFKHDLSLPLANFYELTELVRERLEGTKTRRICTFGHLGDGNTHLNITASAYDQSIHDRLYPFIYEWVMSKGGSISAEHGIGRVKRSYHHQLIAERRRGISSQIKRMFDPRLLLSPYKMID